MLAVLHKLPNEYLGADVTNQQDLHAKAARAASWIRKQGVHLVTVHNSQWSFMVRGFPHGCRLKSDEELIAEATRLGWKCADGSEGSVGEGE